MKMKQKFTLAFLLLAALLASEETLAEAQSVELALFDDYPLANWYFQEFGEPPALKKKDSQPTVTKTSETAPSQSTKTDKTKPVRGKTARVKRQEAR